MKFFSNRWSMTPTLFRPSPHLAAPSITTIEPPPVSAAQVTTEWRRASRGPAEYEMPCSFPSDKS